MRSRARQDRSAVATDVARAPDPDALRTAGALAAGVAHDLATPLACALSNVTVALELAADEGASPDLVEALRDARACAEQAAALVRDLRALARDDGGAGRCDLAAAAATAARLAGAAVRGRASLVVDVPPGLAVAGAPARIARVIVNLLLNAADALPADAAPDRHQVAIRGVARAGGGAVLRVSDDGRGMSAEVAARAFEPYFTTRSPGAGRGLGLAAAREVVAAAGGTMAIDSTPGVGTLVTVVLPAPIG